MDSKRKWTWLFVAIYLTTSCTPSPFPFEYIETPPDNQFIFIALGDNDWTCVDGQCDCIMVEAAAPPFDFEKDILQIDPYYLGNESLLGTNRWPSIRRTEQSIGLFGFYGANTDIYLNFISSFPFKVDRFDLQILGFDAEGSIQIMAEDRYAILHQNEVYEYEVSEVRYENCKILNKLGLKNYGFIKDSNVIFSTEFAGYSGDFPP